MKTNLKQLSPILGEPAYTFICATSFEKRWLNILKNLDRELVNKVVCINQGGDFEELKNGLDYMQSHFADKFLECLVSDKRPIPKAVEFKNLLCESLADDERIVIDITTFTHENLLILYRFIDQLENRENIQFVYNGADEYSVGLPAEEKWLSKGVRDIRSVFGYPGLMYPSQKTHLIILAGFETERAEKLIKEIEPAVISLGVASPGSHINEDHKSINEQFFERLNSFIRTIVSVRSCVDTFEFSCSDPYLTKRAIEKEICRHQGYNIVVCPMNTKISTLGAAMASTSPGEERVQICYVEPIEYNITGYSSPGDDVTLINTFVDSVTSTGKFLGVMPDKSLIERLLEIGTPKKHIEKYERGRHLRSEYNAIDQDSKKLGNAIEVFLELSRELSPNLSATYIEGNGETLLYYYSVMNAALCYMINGDYLLAQELYESLLDSFGDFPVLQQRLGQVFGRTGQYSKSIAHLENAIDIVSDLEAQRLIGSEILPDVDYAHIKEHCPLLLGFQYWVKSISDSSLSNTDKQEFLEKAYTVTQSVIDFQNVSQVTMKEVHNNSLYYLLELASLQSGATHVPYFTDRMLPHLGYLESRSESEEITELDILDTLAKAYAFTGGITVALKYAKKIIRLGGEIIDRQEDVDPSILASLNDAYELIKSYKFRVNNTE